MLESRRGRHSDNRGRTMSIEKTYSDTETEARLKRDCRSGGWKAASSAASTAPMVEGHADGDQHRRSSGRGRMASPGDRRVLCLGRGEITEPCRQGHHRQGFPRTGEEDRGRHSVATGQEPGALEGTPNSDARFAYVEIRPNAGSVLPLGADADRRTRSWSLRPECARAGSRRYRP